MNGGKGLLVLAITVARPDALEIFIVFIEFEKGIINADDDVGESVHLLLKVYSGLEKMGRKNVRCPAAKNGMVRKTDGEDRHMVYQNIIRRRKKSFPDVRSHRIKNIKQ